MLTPKAIGLWALLFDGIQQGCFIHGLCPGPHLGHSADFGLFLCFR